MHLDRDKLPIDEGADGFLEKLQLLGQIEVHERCSMRSQARATAAIGARSRRGVSRSMSISVRTDAELLQAR